MAIEELSLENITVMGLHLTQALKEDLPVADLVAWLTTKYPQAELKQILSMLNVVYQQPFDIQPAATEPQTYIIGNKNLTAYPQTVIAYRE